MKKLLSLLLLSALFIFSCGNKSETKKDQGTAGTKEKIVTSVPPLRWLAQKIAGDDFEVISIVQPNMNHRLRSRAERPSAPGGDALRAARSGTAQAARDRNVYSCTPISRWRDALTEGGGVMKAMTYDEARDNIFTIVVFPAPFCPIIPTFSPFLTSRETSLSTFSVPLGYLKLKFLTVIKLIVLSPLKILLNNYLQ